MAKAGKETLHWNGQQLPLRQHPNLVAAGYKAHKEVGVDGHTCDIEDYVIGKATNVVITQDGTVDVAALRSARDADAVFQLADGRTFVISKAVINGDLEENTGTGEITIDSIEGDDAYYVDG